MATFQQEDGECRNRAATTIGYLPLPPGQAGIQAAVNSAAVGTVVGAAGGAAAAAAAGNAGAGASIGGATGLAGGAAIGANKAAASEQDLQTRYDIAYAQCMYSYGDTVQDLPSSAYGYYGYSSMGDTYYGYPWYDWVGPGFFGGSIFVFGRNHHFHHGFHDGFHRGFHDGIHGGYHGGGGFHG